MTEEKEQKKKGKKGGRGSKSGQRQNQEPVEIEETMEGDFDEGMR